MKFASSIFATLLIGLPLGFSQSFINLGFESANISGYSSHDFVPTTNAIPGWGAFYGIIAGGTDTVTDVVYDEISSGRAEISLVDSNVMFGSIPFPSFYPFQGHYAVCFFSDSSFSMSISQSGLVPIGTQTLLFSARSYSGSFIVSLGGQTLSAVPLQIFPNYTVYGADISGFAGQVATLSFTDPQLSSGNVFELDNIRFSSSPIPEPSALALAALGTFVLIFGRSRHWRGQR